MRAWRANFFSGVPLDEEVSDYEFEDHMAALASYTFSNFIKSPEVQDFLKQVKNGDSMPHLRYAYIFFLFKKINMFIGDSSPLSCFAVSLCEKSAPSVGEVYDFCRAMSDRTRWKLCLALESLTRGQDNNALWSLLRDGVISSSKFWRAVKDIGGSSNHLFDPLPIVNNYYVAGPLAFGLRCESVVKDVITGLIFPQKSSIKNFGFMQSPMDAMFGVSLDLCLNTGAEDLLFTPRSELFEIKCRYKYLFSKASHDRLFPLYEALYMEPTKRHFINFIFGISHPAVEYVPADRVPTDNDYLITADPDWNLSKKRKRKLNNTHALIEQCIRQNSTSESVVYLLTDPAKHHGVIGIKSSLTLNLFINPKHPYFSQVLLQNKIVGEYVEFVDGGADQDVRSFVATGFFRQRDSCDPKVCTIADQTLPTDTEIPVAILVTPLHIPRGVSEESLRRATTYWNNCFQETFDKDIQTQAWAQPHPELLPAVV